MQFDFLSRCADIAGAALGEGAFAPRPAIWVGEREIAHFDGPDLIDVRLTKAVIRERRSELRADERVQLRTGVSDWIRVRASSPSELDHAYVLVGDAVGGSTDRWVIT